MFLVKFGQKEHLEKLRDGKVHLNALSCFLKDGTSYRGDKHEGSVTLSTHTSIIVNGVDFSQYSKKITHTCTGFENTHIFCAAKLDLNSLIRENELFLPSSEFISHLSQFGHYFLIFDTDSFLRSVGKKLGQFIWLYHDIYYCDTNDHMNIQKFLSDNQKKLGCYGQCFIKDYSIYHQQNEWRLLLYDYSNNLHYNPDKSIDIEVEPFTQFPVFPVKDLYTLRISEDLLV